MRLLLDTHVLLALLKEGDATLPPFMRNALVHRDASLIVSTASLWEIVIKVRSGKLGIGIALADLMEACTAARMSLIAIEPHHVLAEVVPEPATRDPFDRLLLAQAAAEDMRLVTLDRMLVGHSRAWQPDA